MAARRQFGTVTQQPNGRYRARYSDKDAGKQRSLGTFTRKRDACLALSKAQADIERGVFIHRSDRPAPIETFSQFAETWLAQRRSQGKTLSVTTAHQYDHQLKKYLCPEFGKRPLDEISRRDVHRWLDALRTTARAKKPDSLVPEKAYRLLRTVMGAAVDRELIAVNPCTIPNAGNEPRKARQPVSDEEVQRLIDASPPRFRFLVIVAAFAGLRFSESAGLRREDLDLDAKSINVSRSLHHVGPGKPVTKSPKSAAGVRTVYLPPGLVEEARAHLDKFVGEDPKSLVFLGPKGGPLRNSTWAPIWRGSLGDKGNGHPARLGIVQRAGLPEGIHFHDLRAWFGTSLGERGATLAEIMKLGGWSSTDAAMRYQRAGDARLRQLTALLPAPSFTLAESA